jgi:mono/diheme cytochrome c family protein
MKTILLSIAAGLLIVAWTVGCGTARRDAPLAGALPLDSPQVAEGRQVFMSNCYTCHPGGDAGLGPAINNKPLPGGLIKTQVRKGLGAMPAFDATRIAEPALENLVAYLQTLRKQGRE